MKYERDSMNEYRPKSTKKKIYAVISALFGIGFLACIIWLINYAMDLNQAEQQMEDIKNAYVQESVESSTEPSTEPYVEASTEASEATEETPASTEAEPESKYPGLEDYAVPEKTIDFAALQEQENEHIYAWITVPGTKIDYPIVQHPESPEYYLNHNLDGSAGYPGCIYTELYNSKDWDDNHTVIYGHNMKNGTMFAGLHYYEDSQFFEEHPYVYIYTEDKVRVYQIFAAYEFGNAHLLLSFDMDNEESFGQYLEGIYEIQGINNNFNEELEVTTEDKIITLETCIANKPDKRYVVQAVLVAEGAVQ